MQNCIAKEIKEIKVMLQLNAVSKIFDKSKKR